MGGARFIVPKQGDKKVLLDLATRNATYHRLEKLKQSTIVKLESTPDKSMVALQNALQLSKLPVHIECFDSSIFKEHTQLLLVWYLRMGNPLRPIIVILILRRLRDLMILPQWRRFYLDAIVV